ncbi:MAG TPA: heavy-metal-associated domain-containing protein [Ktedonosporobacter sp.]|nr:heavy-metal-associated domain-containing protein [Ktedonosporobacter sp.]
MTDEQDITLSVPDVSCEHCVRAIDTSLHTLPGVETVTTDLQTKTVHVHYHAGQVALQQIEAALDEAGYTVAH